MFFNIFKSKESDLKSEKDDQRVKTGDKDVLQLIKDPFQKDKDITDCLESGACAHFKIKLMKCYEKKNKEIASSDENCHKEIVELINCVNQCVAKGERRKAEFMRLFIDVYT
ncbi:UCR_hinge domain-containing protein [Trichonephila inaurata madagascariensis]|uniref:UCR_hinge domain-containing protein n=1 Tax=Trichonephila inaurata madagascariensis TaxID=2747483 RepID=A0A8X7CJV9_9ARAC|nr:UCR_hinge domain-containing protein [Trichonephila inaurata madagascariensis]